MTALLLIWLHFIVFFFFFFFFLTTEHNLSRGNFIKQPRERNTRRIAVLIPPSSPCFHLPLILILSPSFLNHLQWHIYVFGNFIFFSLERERVMKTFMAKCMIIWLKVKDYFFYPPVRPFVRKPSFCLDSSCYRYAMHLKILSVLCLRRVRVHVGEIVLK